MDAENPYIRDRYTILFCFKAGIPPSLCIQYCNSAYPKDAPSRATVYNWYAKFYGGDLNVNPLPKSGRTRNWLSIEDIDDIVNEDPNLSLSSIERRLSISRKIVKQILEDELGFVKRNCKWVPYVLSAENKLKRVQFSQSLLKEVDGNFSNVVTGDESWINWTTANDFAWCKKDDPCPTKPKPNLTKCKTMLTVFWGINGFVVIDFLPQGESMNAFYMLHNVLDSIKNVFASDTLIQKEINVHMDNARPHNAHMIDDFFQGSFLTRLPHPPYSPDIAPSDFYLFGKLNGFLKGFHAESRNAMIAKVREILGLIEKAEFESVLVEWCERLKWVIAHGGEYYLGK
jgi:histone-lysine N-methyltransferase SETMAR